MTDVRLLGLRHTRLTKSAPAKDTTLAASPSTVTLWFSKPVQARLTRIQLVDAKGTVVATDAPAFLGESETVVVAHLRGAAAPGAYTVTWATTSKDSHVVKGSYTFRVNGAR
ncbi:MAG: copper resistance CopC family protein [Gemmatimonadaceae bacterium]